VRATASLPALIAITALTGSLGCGGTQPGAEATDAPNTTPAGAIVVEVDPASVRAAPAFFEALRDDPFRYYRFVNVPFSDETCRWFGESVTTMPNVNLHGDAHIEQYAITSEGRGLADFDDSSTGPAVIDLVRFGTSLRLAADASGLGDATPLIDAFLRGYRDAMESPDDEVAEPSISAEIRAGFGDDRAGFLEMTDGLMIPLDADTEAEVREAFGRYAARLVETSDAGINEAHLVIRAVGGLDIGIGSRLDEKFLVRIEGPTSDPMDDVVIELKEVRDLSGISCIEAGRGGGAFRVLIGQARIGGGIDPWLAPIPAGGEGRFATTPFWARAWYDHYREVDAGGFDETADLAEVAYDVGAQLGRGHVVQIASPLDAQLRAEQLALLDEIEPDLRAAIDAMAERTLEGWRRFGAEVDAAL